MFVSCTGGYTRVLFHSLAAPFDDLATNSTSIRVFCLRSPSGWHGTPSAGHVAALDGITPSAGATYSATSDATRMIDVGVSTVACIDFPSVALEPTQREQVPRRPLPVPALSEPISGGQFGSGRHR